MPATSPATPATPDVPDAATILARLYRIYGKDPAAAGAAAEGLDIESVALAFLLIAREVEKGSNGVNDDIVSTSLIRRWVQLARAGMPGVLAFDAQRAGLI
jgi:hypothetical protein